MKSKIDGLNVPLNQEGAVIEVYYQYKFSCSNNTLNFPGEGGTDTIEGIVSQRRSITVVNGDTKNVTVGEYEDYDNWDGRVGSTSSTYITKISRDTFEISSNPSYTNSRGGSVYIEQVQENVYQGDDYKSDSASILIYVNQERHYYIDQMYIQYTGKSSNMILFSIGGHEVSVGQAELQYNIRENYDEIIYVEVQFMDDGNANEFQLKLWPIKGENTEEARPLPPFYSLTSAGTDTYLLQYSCSVNRSEVETDYIYLKTEHCKFIIRVVVDS